MLWRGLLMGLADSVPGISGGTVAFILRIHARLVAAIAGLNLGWLKALSRWDVAGLKEKDTPFLLMLGLGIVLGIGVGAKVLADWILPTYPGLAMGFLFGLVAFSILIPWRIVEWAPSRYAVAIVAGAFAFWITVANATAWPTTWWILIIAGAIAASAMILPGISGAYILLLLGLYEPILSAVAHFEWWTIALVGLGAIMGLLLFSRGLHWLLQERTHATHAAMVGLLAGSVLRLWPWRTEAGFAHGAPAMPDTWPVAALLVSGILVGWMIDQSARRAQKA